MVLICIDSQKFHPKILQFCRLARLAGDLIQSKGQLPLRLELRQRPRVGFGLRPRRVSRMMENLMENPALIDVWMISPAFKLHLLLDFSGIT